jgi:putative restriction endonuclease
MKFYAGVTDQDWFDYLRSQAGIDEVNFWQPSPDNQFRALEKGDVFLFKLHRSMRTHRHDLIAGGGIFASYTNLPISLAWEAFENRNGAESYSAMRHRLLHYRRIPENPHEDFQVGCIVLTQPFFLDESLWFPSPSWSSSIVRGKGYRLESQDGQFIWKSLEQVWHVTRVFNLDKEAENLDEQRDRYGKETMIRPRLGQGAFRVLVTDAYQRACAITEEHSLPVLEAAHIKPYNESGQHEVNNGVLLRSDFHRLFDRGYITVTPDYRIEVSPRLKEEFKNGRSYYPYHGHHLHHLPLNMRDRPSKTSLEWHNERIFLR